MMRTGFKGLVALIFATASAAPASASVYDALTTFNSTQGAGNFYYGIQGAGAFVPFLVCADVNFTYCLGTTGAPPVFGVGPAHIAGTSMFLSDTVYTHPSSDPSLRNVVYFEAPAAGDYRVEWQFGWQDTCSLNCSNKVGIATYTQDVGQASQFDQRFVLATPLASGSLVKTMAIGDRFGFAIDANGSYGFDSTGFKLTFSSLPGGPGAVPEPSNWALLMTGFGLIGAVMRRRIGRVRA